MLYDSLLNISGHDRITMPTYIKDVLDFLASKDLNYADVAYVVYYIGNYIQTRQLYECSFDDFITFVGDMDLNDIMWKDFKIVADSWWVEYNNYGFVVHHQPYKPKKHRVPSMFDLCKKDYHWLTREHDSHG